MSIVSSGISLKVVEIASSDELFLNGIPLKVANIVGNSESINRLAMRQAGFYDFEIGAKTVFYDMNKAIIRKK